MKCGIITFHRAHNYGGILQAYALSNVIKKMGVECEIIDYRCEFIEKLYQPYSLRNLPSAKMFASIVLRNGAFKKDTKVFQDFRSDYLPLSLKAYNNSVQLKELNKEYDVFITGSDQVWSYFTGGFDSAYFLSFVDDVSKKNAYAASFGVSTIPESFVIEYKERLRDFNTITLRETQGKDIIENLLGEKHPVVLDPTLLLDYKDWSILISNNYKYTNTKYLLVYLIAESKETLDLARKIAKEHDLVIFYISNRIYKKRDMINMSEVSVNDWLDLFYNASFIVTNSFHGVAFSINFKKQFFMQLLPGNAKVNSRLENILKKFRLENRQINNIEKIELIPNIDYEEVEVILESERNKSKKYLKKIINIV
ncbi:polysaccharide pyruvyl transferase family protein [Psychrobacillus glaciei]|uniref:Polysaccharide pyruvyl transferase family protein n=1 Tax=Psychrobacillus glaciei TaxID=2283160 RepID=A0A5J6SJ62_9BACI|nr:polysaccharide pyruvyl transferase family protein [Psychrobacillus glaciei]QFF98026.1 polysaccharide pyruvyl transferase family protein [Psychrobacillus glaciei]